MNINETWKQLKEEITQCDDNKMAVSILLDKIEYLLGEVERLENESELDRNTINAIQGARILSDAHLEAVTQRCEALEAELQRYQKMQDNGRLAELPENESLDIDSSINAITNIVKNDYFVFKGNKTFIVDMFISKDPREETEFIAECKDYQTDSYGVEGSEFYCCGCEDETICKYAGSEFKHWDETDPDPIEIGCRIRFTDRDLGKTVFLAKEEAQQALEDGK